MKNYLFLTFAIVVAFITTGCAGIDTTAMTSSKPDILIRNALPYKIVPKINGQLWHIQRGAPLKYEQVILAPMEVRGFKKYDFPRLAQNWVVSYDAYDENGNLVGAGDIEVWNPNSSEFGYTGPHRVTTLIIRDLHYVVKRGGTSDGSASYVPQPEVYMPPTEKCPPPPVYQKP